MGKNTNKTDDLAIEASRLVLEWDVDGRDVRLGDNMIFSPGYDWLGWEHLREEATGIDGKYAIWPSGLKRQFSIYRESDGCFVFERFDTIEEAKERAQEWNEENTEEADASERK